MKKFLSVVLAVLMCVLPLTANVPAAELMVDADATITLSPEAGECGDSIEVKVYLTTAKTFNTFGLRYISYDEDYLTFDGCVVDPAFTSMLTKFDEDKMILSTSLNTPMEGCENALVCTLKFTINDDAPIGETTVTATEGVVKNTGTNYTTEIVDSTVTVKGLDFPTMTFKNKTVTYNSEVQTIEVANVPDYATVAYTVNGEAFDGAEDAGTYDIVATVTAPGYNKEVLEATLEIEPKVITVNAVVSDKEYDGTDKVTGLAGMPTIDGYIQGDDLSIKEESFATVRFADSKAGTHAILHELELVGADKDNYEYTINVPKASITKKSVTITVNDVNLKVGDELPAEYTYTVTPTLGEECAPLVGTVKADSKANTNTAKNYTITATFSKTNNPNYDITIQNGTLYVKDKTPQDVYVSPVEDKVYGDEPFKISYGTGDNSMFVSDEPWVFTAESDNISVNGNTVTILGAGTAKINASKKGDAVLADFEETITFAVNKKPLTITADNKTATKGGELPEFTCTIVGLVGDDTIETTFTTTAKNTNTVKDYPITVKVTVKNYPNYNITLVPGTLSVIDKTPQDITVTSNAPSSITYGDEAFDIVVNYGENVSDNATTFSSNNEEVATVNVNGKVTIVGAGTAKITVAREGDENLADFSEDVTVTVAKKEIKVIANAREKYVGQDTPKLTYTYEGELVEGDEFTGALTVSDGNKAGKTYDIKIGTLSLGDNYKITFEGAKLSVLAKVDQDVVEAVVVEVEYGYPEHEIKLVEDTSKYNTNATKYFTSSKESVATVSRHGEVTVVGAGQTKITVSVAGNYKFNDYTYSYTLTVTKRPITITAADASKKVGADDPELTYTLTGKLADGDTLTGNVAREEGEEVGSYIIGPGTLSLTNSANYDVNFVGGTFTIFDKTPQDITVETTTYEKTYGDEAFGIVVNYGENVSDNATTFSSNNEEVATVDADGNVTIVGAGTAKITVAREGDDDLAAFEKTVTVVVAKKAIKVIADAKEKYVGEVTPELTYTYEGELVGDDEFTGALTVSDGDKAGKSYDIKIGTLSLGDNYKITFEGAKLSVLAKVEQQITVADVDTFTYGEDSGFTVEITYDGEYNTESGITFESSNEEVATVDADGNVTILGAGVARISVAFEGNHKFYPYEETIFVTVGKADLDFVIDDQVKKIGTDDPEFTYSYTGLVDGDEISGTPEREEGEELGAYNIKPGTLTVSCPENYNIGYAWGTLTIVDKNPQTVDVTGVPEESLVYGGDGFTVTATSADVEDAVVTYESSDETVLTVDENGNVAIVGAGVAEIKVTVAGNDDYADAVVTKAVIVNAKEIAITALDLVNKTVTFDAVVEGDTEAVSVDFNGLTLVPEDVEEGQTPENYVVTGFELTGDKSANYTLTTESVLVPMSDEIELVNVTVVAENGTVEGAGTYLAGSEVTLTATPDSGYKFSAWYAGEEKVSSDAEHTFTAEADVELTAKFSKKSTGGSVGGGGGTPTRTVYFKVDDENTTAVTVNKGDKVQKPEDPTLEGYTFGGWFADEELTQVFDFDKAVDTSITLYAKWTAVETEPDDGEDKPDDGEGKTEEWKNPYTDVKDGDWYYGVVKSATEAGIMNGVSENTFAPNSKVTRAMLVTMLYRAENSPETSGDVAFEDIVEGSYYADAVAWAAEKGIVLGVSKTEFAPNADVTREQIAAIIFRYAGYKGVEAVELSENLFFADADKISEYAVAPMNWLVGKEIITGYEDGTVRPQGSATRAEVAAITARILAYLAQ